MQGLRIADGTTDIMRQQVVRSTYGDDLWAMTIGTQDYLGGHSSSTNFQEFPAAVFVAVRNMRTATNPSVVAVQKNYDDMVDIEGGGACPTVAVANLMQGLGVLAGLKKSINLDVAIKESYQQNPTLSKGRLTNLQVIELVKSYQEKYLPQTDVSIRLDSNRFLWNPEVIPDSKIWNDMDSSLLSVNARELKLVSYSIFDDGQLIGRHFVILKD